jgi:hypothetical protein
MVAGRVRQGDRGLHRKTKENTKFEQKDAKEAKTDQDGVGDGLGAIRQIPRFRGRLSPASRTPKISIKTIVLYILHILEVVSYAVVPFCPLRRRSLSEVP